ncbi:hypothetical protein CC86DRAFT_100636 [Ophiobolus disseminans]|uniref:Uncharacterized protein n=1 Tax=Ophiobolus disseminans TaxID=1469910 RepID=A0A6A6ZNH1_9PLEO|nr:hypothetical protein CC86DRAFT_100636 [Ophiobolus disseminans]
MATLDNNYQAQVEDYHSDDSAHVTERSVPRNKSPSAQANVSQRRSKDLKSDKASTPEKTVPANIDGRSDSGTTRHPPIPPPVTAPAVPQSPAPKPRRPTGGDSRQHSNESSPRQKPSRTASVSSKQRPAASQRRPTVTDDRKLPDPNWLTCGPNAEREMPPRRRPEMPPPSMSSRSIRDNYPSDQLSQHSDPNPYSPPSPTYTRQPAPYSAQGPAIVQTARTRRPSAAGTRPRPQSFAGDPRDFYGYPSPPQEPQSRGGPPQAFYNNMQHMANMPNMPNMQYPGMPPPYMHPVQQPGYQYPPHVPAQPTRPDMSARGSSSFGRSFPAPIITQDGGNEPNQYSARYGRQPPTPVEQHHQPQKRLSHHPPPKLLQYGEPRYEDEQSSEEASSEEEEEEDEPVYDEYDAREEQRRLRALMPPPKLVRAQSQRRPPLAHSKTAPAVERVERRADRRKSIVVNDPLPAREPQREQRERERAQRTTTDPMRRPSVSRPRPHRQTQSEYVTPQARIEVNNSRSNRRQSYQAYEKAQMEYAREQQAIALEERYKEEQKRQRRASKVYVQQERRHVPGQFDDEDDEESESEEEEPPAALRARRKTDADERRKGKDRGPEPKNIREVSAAEEYIMSTRGSRDPYADSINKAAKRGSRMPALHSDSGSSRSGGSGRASQSNRTTMTSNTNNEVRLRLESGQAINLQLSGDMEGRTLQLLPAENGMTDLVIGNARGGETVYNPSESSSRRGAGNPNRRSIMGPPSRRENEDVSERSLRTGRSRREHDEILERRDDRDHVLRRARKTTYH